MHTLEQLRRGELAGIRRLDLSIAPTTPTTPSTRRSTDHSAGLSPDPCTPLTELPPEVLGLADTLEVLNLSGHQLTSLPHDLARLTKLKVVFASGNPFTHLPEVLGDCPALDMVGFKGCRIAHVPAAALPPRLRWLTLTDNAIASLPPELGQRPRLQKLMLAGNHLAALPDSLASAQRLELVRLAANRLAHLPGWLPELPRLAWLALAGNPLGWPLPPLPQLPRVHWGRVRVGALLGEGASGWIHRVAVAGGVGAGVGAEVNGVVSLGASAAGDPPTTANPLALAPAALKLFKGQVTSDGLPEHELAASLAAGQHPALCTPNAELSGHPQGLQGLFMPVIPPGYANLAAPPSLDSCTRDVYPPGLVLAPAVLHTMATHMASALAHLHAQGVVHGDFYAHNMLWHPATGATLLTDFGAATRLPLPPPKPSDPTQPPSQTQDLRRLDVLAFGWWLQEVLDRVAPPGMPTAWAALAQACSSATPSARPGMAEVCQILKAK